jgi:transcriptional regulator with XRE-family HTH domain
MRSPQPVSYGSLLARNLRVARAAANLSQNDVGERMRNLGFTAWQRSTVSLAEQGKRRLIAEEVFALAYALDTTIARLVRPTEDDQRIAFPSGRAVEASSVTGSARGARDGAIRWDGNTPVFFEGSTRWPAGYRDVFDPAADDQRAADFIASKSSDSPDG